MKEAENKKAERNVGRREKITREDQTINSICM
jgi:hypothetical protein